jgi:hypothetical protein
MTTHYKGNYNTNEQVDRKDYKFLYQKNQPRDSTPSKFNTAYKEEFSLGVGSELDK